MQHHLCIPNVSEGRRPDVIERIAGAARTAGTKLLDIHSDPDHNRSVFTLAGPLESLSESALSMAQEAMALIDLGKHEGVHPRMGAIDVVPFTASGQWNDGDLRDAIDASVRTARRLWEELGIPCFLYEMAALKRHADAISLPQVRRHAFEILAPDFGGPGPHPTAGATTVGARKRLVAYNIFIETQDVEIAKQIASQIRSSGGGLEGVRALGFYLPSRRCAQISMSLFRPEHTTMADAYDAVLEQAKKNDVRVLEAELVGLCPASALGGRDPASLGLPKPPKVLEEVLR